MRRWATSVALVIVAQMGHAQTAEDEPLSAIDWLSESVEQPEVVAAAPDAPQLGTQANRTPDPDEAPVAGTATSPTVTVQPLGAPAPRAIGLLGPETTGLPSDLWQNSDGATLGALIGAKRLDSLPALQDLMKTLVLAEANPPLEATAPGTFLQARVDKLLDFGALDRAQALLEAADPDTPELFRRFFDVSLLTGTETAACRALQNRPEVAPTPAARIFCLARSGDWTAAALTLNTGRTLGDIDPATADLLARFLDPELFEGEPSLAPPNRVSPLLFRMFEAIGEPLSTNDLPRAFAHSDLRDNVGWKAQLEAAERLARSGGIDVNTLYGLYTERRPSASGGVWERAAAVQALSSALRDDPDDLPKAIDTFVDETDRLGLLAPLARVFGPDLLEADLPAEIHAQAFRIMLLSDVYEAAALNDDLAATDPFLASVARGAPSDDPSNHPQADLIRAAFAAAPAPALMEMAQQGRTGEAILRSISTIEQGLDGDQMAFAEGIATLRALGLEDVARRTALQVLLLDR